MSFKKEIDAYSRVIVPTVSTKHNYMSNYNYHVVNDIASRQLIMSNKYF